MTTPERILLIKTERVEHQCDDIGLDDGNKQMAELTDPLCSFFSNQKFECRLCDFNSGNMQTIATHVNVHTNEQLFHSYYECSQCMEWIKSELNLKKHFETHISSREKGNETHVVSTSFEKVLLPSIEIESFPTKSVIETQSSLERIDSDQKDDNEAESISNDGELTFSSRAKKWQKIDCKPLKKSQQNIFECNQCLKRLSSRLGLQNHMHRIHNVKDETKAYHKCKFCSKNFQNQYILNVHTRTHTGDRPLKCHLCPETFNRHELLIRHKLKHSGEAPFACHFDKCGKRFFRKDLLKRHIAKHTGEKKYECEICSNSFITKFELGSHMIVHIGGRKPGKKNFLCEICSHTFQKPLELERHMMKHRGEKPFACEMCQFRTHTPLYLAVHKKKHETPTRIECNECPKKFSSQSALKQHLVRHTGFKQFGCHMCDRTFYTQHELTDHIKSFHKREKPYECTDCSQKYACKRYQLRRVNQFCNDIYIFICIS